MARYQATLTCQNCSAEFTTSPRWAKTTKFCKLCQVIRDASRYRSKMGKRTCSNCERTFWPIRSGKHWERCGYCDMHPLPECTTCATCGSFSRPAEGLNSSCLGCVQNSEQRRDQYVDRITAIVNDRRAAYAAEVSAPAAGVA